jgi:dolichol-phosphate mannosyltransferase
LQSWSLIIFCYNEKETIKAVIDDALNTMLQMAPANFEIIVVDDGSTDGSGQIIKNIESGNDSIKGIYHSINRGIGEALISGYNSAKNENVCAIPADGQFTIRQIIEYSTIQPHSILSFYREKNTIYSPFRRILSWCNRQMLHYVFSTKVRDINWVKVYKRDDLQSICFELRSSIIESEIVIKLIAAGVQLIEVPTLYLPRTSGKSKGASFKIMKNAIGDIPKLFAIIKAYRANLAAHS